MDNLQQIFPERGRILSSPPEVGGGARLSRLGLRKDRSYIEFCALIRVRRCAEELSSRHPGYWRIGLIVIIDAYALFLWHA